MKKDIVEIVNNLEKDILSKKYAKIEISDEILYSDELARLYDKHIFILSVSLKIKEVNEKNIELLNKIIDVNPVIYAMLDENIKLEKRIAIPLIRKYSSFISLIPTELVVDNEVLDLLLEVGPIYVKIFNKNVQNKIPISYWIDFVKKEKDLILSVTDEIIRNPDFVKEFSQQIYKFCDKGLLSKDLKIEIREIELNNSVETKNSILKKKI